MHKVAEALSSFDSVSHYLELAVDTMTRDKLRRDDSVNIVTNGIVSEDGSGC